MSLPAPVDQVHHSALQVLDVFALCTRGQPVRLPLGAQRCIAYLAMRPRPQCRAGVAAQLWPDLPEARAAATMRSILWQVRKRAPGVINGHADTVTLGPAVGVDVRRAIECARQLTGPEPRLDDWANMVEDLGYDILPTWPDDWLVLERERYRQIRLHALESLSRALSRTGHTQPAIDLALNAVAADPLRETAQRALIEAHLADGNLSEALRQYQIYVRTLRSALGVEPTQALAGLVLDRKMPTSIRQ